MKTGNVLRDGKMVSFIGCLVNEEVFVAGLHDVQVGCVLFISVLVRFSSGLFLNSRFTYSHL